MNIHESMLDEFKDEQKLKQLALTPEQMDAWIMGTFLFSIVWSIGGSSGIDGRKAFNLLLREIIAGPLLPRTKSQYHIYESCDPPTKPFPVPFPEEGEVYDYQFVKEGMGRYVRMTFLVQGSRRIFNTPLPQMEPVTLAF